MNFFKTTLFILLCVGIGQIDLSAQISLPPPSPYAEFTQMVGYTKVGIEYSRPSMRKRTIFGGLVPYGEVWRTGANASTKISFNSDVTIEGKELPHGTYSLLTIPREDSWIIIFNNDLDLRGTRNYDVGKDQLRVEVPTQNIDCHFETFLIDVGELTSSTATVQLIWENTIVKFSVGTYTDKEIMAKIDAALDDPITRVGNTYYSSASYYLDHHKDMDKAMMWIDKAIEINGENANYLYLKAQLYAEKGNFSSAMATLKKAKSMAMAKGNMDNLITSMDLSMDKWKMNKSN